MDFNERLIDEVKQYQILFDYSRKSYRRANDKKEIWATIAARLNSTPENCKVKWKSMRDTYKKYRRESISPSGKNRETWKYYNDLRFLDRFTNFARINQTIADDDESSAFAQHTLQTSESMAAMANWTADWKDPAVVMGGTTTTADGCPIKKRKLNNFDEDADDQISRKFIDFLSIAIENIKSIYGAGGGTGTASTATDPSTSGIGGKLDAKKNNTTLLFAALEKKIQESNLPQEKITEIEMEISNVVYRKILEYKQSMERKMY